MISICLFLLLLKAVHGFYLPGMSPHDYSSGDLVNLYVNALYSPQTLLPFDYYDERFNFCAPTSIISVFESLGSILRGDRLYSSAYTLEMNVNQSCVALCQKTVSAADSEFINNAISNSYFQNWVVDGLPVGSNSSAGMSMGFELGLKNGSDISFYNHHDLLIKYHKHNDKFRVVFVQIVPRSIAFGSSKCFGTDPLLLNQNEDNNVQFSYSVTWLPSEIPWGTRWDSYLYVTDSKIHWFSMINSAVIVTILLLLVVLILVRSLREDIVRYNSTETLEDLTEEFGWKLVHGDVFRRPRYSVLFSVLIGNGAQVLLMFLSTIFFAAIGLLSPTSRGALPTVMIVFYCLFAFVAGYVSARLMKMFGDRSWKRAVFLTAFLVPG
jgi:transmembrane 9 superfamily protein 2/4